MVVLPCPSSRSHIPRMVFGSIAAQHRPVNAKVASTALMQIIVERAISVTSTNGLRKISNPGISFLVTIPGISVPPGPQNLPPLHRMQCDRGDGPRRSRLFGSRPGPDPPRLTYSLSSSSIPPMGNCTAMSFIVSHCLMTNLTYLSYDYSGQDASVQTIRSLNGSIDRRRGNAPRLRTKRGCRF